MPSAKAWSRPLTCKVLQPIGRGTATEGREQPCTFGSVAGGLKHECSVHSLALAPCLFDPPLQSPDPAGQGKRSCSSGGRRGCSSKQLPKQLPASPLFPLNPRLILAGSRRQFDKPQPGCARTLTASWAFCGRKLSLEALESILCWRT